MSKNDLRAAIGKLSKAVIGDEHLNSGPEGAGLVPEDLIASYRVLATNRS